MHLASIHWQVWLIIVLLAFGNTARIMFVKTTDPETFLYVSTITLLAVTLYLFILSYQISNVVTTLEDNYDDFKVDAGRIMDEEAELLDELEQEESAEYDYIMGGGCFDACCARICCVGCKRYGCCCRTPTRQHSIFPCRSPSTVTKAIQLAVVLIAFAVPVYILEITTAAVQFTSTNRLAANLALGIPPLLLLIYFIPDIVPRFVIATSVAGMSRKSEIRATMDKIKAMEKKEHRMKRLNHDSRDQMAAARDRDGVVGVAVVGLDSKYGDGKSPATGAPAPRDGEADAEDNGEASGDDNDDGNHSGADEHGDEEKGERQHGTPAAPSPGVSGAPSSGPAAPASASTPLVAQSR